MANVKIGQLIVCVGDVESFKNHYASVGNDFTIVEKYPETRHSPRKQWAIGGDITKYVANGHSTLCYTYSRTIVTRIRWDIFSKKISNEQVVIYFCDESESIQKVCINTRAKFVDGSGNEIDFPSGFYDVGLAELMKMNGEIHH